MTKDIMNYWPTANEWPGVKTPRKPQIKVLESIAQDWDSKEMFVCEAGPGVGKSAIAVTLSKFANSAFVVTSTKQLQDQYARDFVPPLVVPLKGRANYPCAVMHGLVSVENGPCVSSPKQLEYCQSNHVCAYYNQRDAALQATCALLSYPYFFYSSFCGNFWEPRELVVCDEAHVLEHQITSWATLVLRPNDIYEKFKIRIPRCPQRTTFHGNYDWLMESKTRLVTKRKRIMKSIMEKYNSSFYANNSMTGSDIQAIVRSHREYYDLDKEIERINIAMGSPKRDTWVVTPDGDGVRMVPFDIDDIFYRYIRPMGKRFLFMSASIFSFKSFARDYKLAREKRKFIRIDSPFPADKSPIFFEPVCSMSNEQWAKNIDEIVDKIKEIMEYHQNEKGIIHTGNYRIAEAIASRIRSSRLIYRQNRKDNNEKLVRQHVSSPDPTILLSPSLMIGLDLPDDLGRFQVVIKLPWVSLGDERVKRKIQNSPGWYGLLMFRDLYQSCGRSIRHENDHATTYILDATFPYWYHRYKKVLPRSFQRRLIGV